MEYYVSLKDKFSVTITAPLTNFDQKVFFDLFQPILSTDASSLFQNLNALVGLGQVESKETEHKTILKTLKMNTIDAFLRARYELEAVGLLDTYIYNNASLDENTYVYVIKKIPTPWEFFNDQILSTLLCNAVGENNYHELAGEYLAHRYDLENFEKITRYF